MSPLHDTSWKPWRSASPLGTQRPTKTDLAAVNAPFTRPGAQRLAHPVEVIRPNVVAILGVTAFRTAFSQPRATLGNQTTEHFENWPKTVQLWVLPNPSGLNAHENVATHAAKWRTVWSAATKA